MINTKYYAELIAELIV